MTAVFISYSRQDQDFVRRLHGVLDAQGRDSWVDWQGIPPTAEWMAEIRRAIDGADAALFVISPAWVSSAVCADELAHAVRQGKRLVPVLCRDAAPGSVPEALARLNWVLLRDSDDFDGGVRQLLAGLDVDLAWVREHTRLIVRAQEWQDAAQDDAGLLRGRELDEAERWLAAGATHADPAPSALQVAYIGSSRTAARRRQRTTFGLVLTALVVAIGLAIWAFIERSSAIANANEAIVQKGIAVEKEKDAVEQEGIAKAQTVVAEQQTDAAKKAREAEAEQRKAAQKAQVEAERQRDEAVRQRIAAQARQLAARAEAQPVADPALLQKSALLAAESLRLMPNAEADQVLRRAIARLPQRLVELPHAGIVDTDAVDSDGQFMAFVDAKGMLHVVDIGRMVETFRFDAGGRARHVHVDRAGRYVLLTSRRDGTVLVLTNGGSPRRIEECDAVGAAFGGPAATQLVIGCHRELRVIDAEDATVPERVFEEVDGKQLALAYNGGGDRLAGVDEKGNITVWNVADGKRIARVRGQDSSTDSWSICCTAFIGWSAGGDYIAANNLADKQLHLISTRTWDTHLRLQHRARVNVFAFASRDDLLASGDRSGAITVWDLTNGAIVARMAHGGEITHLELHGRPWSSGDPEAELLSASTDRTARVWNPFTGAELARASQITPVIRVTRPWAPHFGRRFVSLDNHSGLTQWDTRPPPPLTPVVLPQQRRDGRASRALHCSEPGGQRHWFSSASQMVGWEAARPNSQRDGVFYGGTAGQPVAIDPACHWLALATQGELLILDPASRSGAPGSADRPLFKDATGLADAGDWWHSPRGRLLAWRDRSLGGRIWRTAAWGRIDPGDDCKPGAIVTSPAETAVAIACGNSLRVFDIASGRETARLAVPGLAALTDNGRVVLRTRSELSVMQLPSGRVLGRTPLTESFQSGALAIDAGGRWVAVAGKHAVGLWTLPTLQSTAVEKHQPVRSPAGEREAFTGELQFSPDSRHLLVHGFDRLFVFDTEPWTARAELIHPGEADLVQWDLAARRLLAQVAYQPLDRSTLHSVRGWNIDSGNELFNLPIERPADAISVSADGRFLLADQMHRLSADELLATVCRQVARNLTRREWQAEFGSLPYRRTCEQLPEPAPEAASWDQ